MSKMQRFGNTAAGFTKLLVFCLFKVQGMENTAGGSEYTNYNEHTTQQSNTYFLSLLGTSCRTTAVTRSVTDPPA